MKQTVYTVQRVAADSRTLVDVFGDEWYARSCAESAARVRARKPYTEPDSEDDITSWTHDDPHVISWEAGSILWTVTAWTVDETDDE